MSKLCLATLGLGSALAVSAADRILIFTKTQTVREDNIVQTRTSLKTFFEGKGLLVDTSESGSKFSDTALAKYKAVVFHKTTGDFLNADQQAAFERFFQAGGGALVLHASLDAEMNWAFYGKIIAGAYFGSLGGQQTTNQTIVVEDSTDPSTAHLPKSWKRTDEIYNYKVNPRNSTNPKVHVLLTLDESSYPGGKAGTDHPVSWYATYMGGRSWVTSMGHTTASYADANFLGHLWGGMQYVLNSTVTPVAFPKQISRDRKRFSIEWNGFQATGRKVKTKVQPLSK